MQDNHWGRKDKKEKGRKQKGRERRKSSIRRKYPFASMTITKFT
jgi:hypothetical protein